MPTSAAHFTPVLTYEQIAAELGCTKQAVQQLERRALIKLSAYCRAHELLDATDLIQQFQQPDPSGIKATAPPKR